MAIVRSGEIEPAAKIETLNLRLLAVQVLGYVPGSILPAFISLASAAIFTRVFSAGEYGQYSLIISVTALVTAMSSQWLQQAVNRYLPTTTSEAERQRIKQVTAAGVVVICGLLAGAGTLAYILLPLTMPPQWQGFFLPAALLVIATGAFNPVGVVLQAEMQARRFSYYNLANAAGKLVLSLLIIFTVSREPAGMVWGAALSAILLLPALWRQAGMPALTVLRRADWPSYWIGIKRFATYGFPMIGWFLAATLLNVGDRYVIQWFRGSAEVGIYSANYNLIQGAVGLVAAPVLLAAHPFLMRAWGEGDKENAGRWLGTIAEWFALAGIMLVGATWLFSSDLATWFLGAEFRAGHVIMPAVIAGVVAWQLGMYAHKPLEFAERTTLMFILSLMVAVLNLVLNIIFVPMYGYTAAAYTTLIGFVTYAIITGIAGRRFLRWRVRPGPIGVTMLITVVSVAGLAEVRHLTENAYGHLPGFLVTLAGCSVAATVIFKLAALNLRKSFAYLRH